MNGGSEHWNGVYGKRAVDQVSWFQHEARLSLDLIDACQLEAEASIVDVGAGASVLVDGLLARGYRDITLLDITDTAFEATRARLPAGNLQYVVADITRWEPKRTFDLWHDRAVFHFLTEEKDRAAYRAALAKAVPSGGHVVIGTFATDGPERCSGLPVQRYSGSALADEFRGVLRAVEERSERHQTPSGAEQSFVFVRFVRE